MSIYLSIVIPLYNEEESIDHLFEKLLITTQGFDFDYEVILVDDGSHDNTWEMIEKAATKKEYAKFRGIKFKKNFGQTSAMVAGFDHAKGEIIVTLDGDLQNDPSDIPKLLEKIEQGYDIVSGWRYNRKDNYLRVLPSKIANYLISRTTGTHLHDYGCSLKAYRSECIRSVNAYGEMHRFFPAMASMTGARVTEIKVTHHPREFGTSKYGFDRIFKVFSDIFAINFVIKFSSLPLRGFFLSSLPFLAMTAFFSFLSLVSFFFDWTSGKTLFFIMLTVFSGLSFQHLNLLGVLGELILRSSDLSHTQLPEITLKTKGKLPDAK